MSLSGLYNRLPPDLQSVAVSMYGLWLKNIRYGGEYRRHKALLRSTEGLPIEDLRVAQDELLVAFVRFARSTPFFRRQFERIEIKDVRGVADLVSLPVLTKDLIRKYSKDMRSRWSPFDIHAHTGGTTGTPIDVIFWRRDFQRRMAMLDYYREQWGFRNGMRRATFSGRIIAGDHDRVFWRHNGAMSQRLYSTFHLAEKNLDVYVDDLQRFKPTMIDGFPSAISRIARYMVDRGVVLDSPPKVIFTTSENLYDFQRDLFARAFGCLTANQYASGEGAPFIVECPKGRLHYDLRSGVIEVQPNGEILVTSFTTHGTPLIRYAIGDCVELFADDPGCTCGNNNPTVKAVRGRHQDFLVSRERGLVAVGLIDIFKVVPPVVTKAQIQQRELAGITLLLVTDDRDAARNCFSALEEEIKKRMGGSIRVDIEFVDDIELDASGKFRYIKNLLPARVTRNYV